VTVLVIALGAGCAGWVAFELFVGLPRAFQADLAAERAAWNGFADEALAAGNYPAASACREIASRGRHFR
jgi:hypothetical protein